MMSELPKVSDQLQYLVDTDEAAANARAQVLALEHWLKIEKARGFLSAEGTAGEREATALTSPAYLEKLLALENAIGDSELYKTKRKSAELHIEVWRSKNANQRRGNI